MGESPLKLSGDDTSRYEKLSIYQAIGVLSFWKALGYVREIRNIEGGLIGITRGLSTMPLNLPSTRQTLSISVAAATERSIDG